MQHFAQLWNNAKKINAYNKKLTSVLPYPLNQIQLTHIKNNTAYCVAPNTAILSVAKGHKEQILTILNQELNLKANTIIMH